MIQLTWSNQIYEPDCYQMYAHIYRKIDNCFHRVTQILISRDYIFQSGSKKFSWIIKKFIMVKAKVADLSKWKPIIA